MLDNITHLKVDKIVLIFKIYKLLENITLIIDIYDTNIELYVFVLL